MSKLGDVLKLAHEGVPSFTVFSRGLMFVYVRPKDGSRWVHPRLHNPIDEGTDLMTPEEIDAFPLWKEITFGCTRYESGIKYLHAQTLDGHPSNNTAKEEVLTTWLTSFRPDWDLCSIWGVNLTISMISEESMLNLERESAVMMGSHVRLGAGSPLRSFERAREVLHLICDFAFWGRV